MITTFTLQSYGGFVAAHVVERTSHLFKCAVSIAPVTDFKLYGKL